MHGIHTIDCHYLGRPRLAAAYLIQDGDEAAFVDNCTAHSVPTLLSTLDETGLAPEQVRYIIITHVHLDHAGGTSALAEACPNATVIAHPRAARHVIDPARLVASATAVYGEEQFNKVYGVISPVAADRVREMDDEETLDLGGRTLRFLHTRGHANHHFCIADDKSNAVFTGDAFGLHYPDLQSGGPFAFPSTTPTDFDAELACEAIERLVALDAAVMYPTHFGGVTEIAMTSKQLLRHLAFAAELCDDAFSSDLPGESWSAHGPHRLEDE